MAAGHRLLHWAQGSTRIHGCLLSTLFPLLFLSQFFASAADFFPLQKPDFAKSPFAATPNILLYSMSKNFQGSREDVIKKAIGAAASMTVGKYTSPYFGEASSNGSSERILPAISLMEDNKITESSHYTIPPDPSRASSDCSVSDTWLKKIHGGVLSLSCSYLMIDPKNLLKVLYHTAEISNVEFNAQMQPFSAVGSFLGTGKEDDVAAVGRGVGRLNRVDETADAHELSIGEEGGKSIESVKAAGGTAAASFPSPAFEFFKAKSASNTFEVNSSTGDVKAKSSTLSSNPFKPNSSPGDVYKANSSPSSKKTHPSTVDVQNATSSNAGNFYKAAAAKPQDVGGDFYKAADAKALDVSVYSATSAIPDTALDVSAYSATSAIPDTALDVSVYSASVYSATSAIPDTALDVSVYSATGAIPDTARNPWLASGGGEEEVVSANGLNLFPQNPDDTYFPAQWELRDDSTFSVQAQSAWLITTGGSGTVAEQPLNTVGIVDASCLQSHPDLVGEFFENQGEICGNNLDDDNNGLLDDCNGWNFADGNNDLILDGADPNSPWGYHGTAVSGCIGAASNNGQGIASVCPHCRILPIATFLFNSEIVFGINYLVSQGIRIINFSFGSDEPSTAVRDAIIDTAIYDSVLFVISSGNSGCDLDANVQNPTPGCGGWPASFSQHYRNVVSVGATAEPGVAASFSNYGATTVTVFAPGESVHSTFNTGLVPEVGTISGTSFSAPITAGIAAMVLQQHPSLTSCQLRRILELSCTPNPALVGKSVCNGHLNAETALIQGDLEFQNPTVLTCYSPADPNHTTSTTTSTTTTSTSTTSTTTTVTTTTSTSTTSTTSTRSTSTTTSSTTIAPTTTLSKGEAIGAAFSQKLLKVFGPILSPII